MKEQDNDTVKKRNPLNMGGPAFNPDVTGQSLPDDVEGKSRLVREKPETRPKQY